MRSARWLGLLGVVGAVLLSSLLRVSPPPLTSNSGFPITDLTARTPRHCGGVFPLNGTWSPKIPPHFFPRPDLCDVAPVASPSSVFRCLERRGHSGRPARLFFMGNSFARGYAYTLQRWMIGRGEVRRQKQKEACAKSRESTNKAHQSCTLPIGRNQTLSVLWRGVFGDRLLAIRKKKMAIPRDYCTGSSAVDCHRSFFGSSYSGDILITNIGRAYVEMNVWRGRENAGALVGDFADLLGSGVFNGSVVWITTTIARPGGAYDTFNRFTDALNERVASNLTRLGALVMDQRNFISGVAAEDTWVDDIHPPPSGYLATLLYSLAAVCGDALTPNLMDVT